MIDSAIDRKSATTERITLCAQRLTDAHGIDGYTMDDLAKAAEVSRRTLFNYFPSKVDAVLGVWPTLDDDDVDEFRAGGPDHDLLQDLRTMVLPLFESELTDREMLEVRRRMLLGNPRLLIQVHARYESLSAEIVEHIAVREGPTFGGTARTGGGQGARSSLRLRPRRVPARPQGALDRAPLRRGAAHGSLPVRRLSRPRSLTSSLGPPQETFMATLLYRLGKTAYHHWPRFVAGWLLLLVAVGGTAAGFSKPFSDSFSIPGIPSEQAAELQEQLFPMSQDAFDQANVNVVVQAPEGEQLTDYTRPLNVLAEGIAGLPQMSSDPTATNPGLGNPVELAKTQAEQALENAQTNGTAEDVALANYYALAPVTADGRTGIVTFQWDVDSPADVKAGSINELKSLLDTTRGSGLTVEMNGTGSQLLTALGGTAELIGIGLALIVLLLTFGSVVAAGLPILTAVLGVSIGLTGVLAMTALFDLNSSTITLSSMIGLAVGIDYTLFILARYRSELQHTDDRAEAVGIAVGTAGSAVVFAGLTVLIALSALAVVGIPFLTAMGLAAAATVLIAVLVALTLLPAVLGMLKSRAFGGQVRRYRPARDDNEQILNNGVRWGRLVTRRPVAFALLVVVALGVIAIPMKGLHLAFPTDSTAATDTTQRQASDIISAEFGPGREGPLLVVVDAREAGADSSTAFGDVARWASDFPSVANAQVVATNADPSDPNAVATGALIRVQPVDGPDNEATEELLREMRDGQSAIEQQSGTTVGVTGLTAITTDVSDQLSDALPVYLAVVIGLAFILLMLVFRSILVPLMATFGFLLSVLATLGATVAVFQEGLFGIFDPQPIVSFTPIFLIGVVFGLAMDYQVFLVTRMREAHVHGASTHEAVIDGFRSSARVVTAAAIIMTAVFSGFILEHDVVVKSMGFALAVAVVFDAFIVRMILIPALMQLLGEKAWYLPAWLDRLLPHVDVEGERLQRTHPSVLLGHNLADDDDIREPVSVG